ncbi:EAL domain-containing response regulator [Pseudomonas sp. 1912-s]|uniref:EAL domain-containing response regulator n=1 Tax=Pseudomonas sp. 1912-s TaxID=3033802 RepID=UPI0023DE9D13|nr:EAL domain-containing response regulator [Pseudomonas sp. 1912-s]MDF3202859.1 EAL domain-containing response regulator [Pseudomonas sp. 1912-s]
MPYLSIRALVVEDNPFQRSLTVSLLKQLGCREVLEADNGGEALAILQAAGSVDVALCDLQMEDREGLEFILRAGGAGQLGTVLITSCLPYDVGRAVRQIGALLGLNIIMDVAMPLRAGSLRKHLDGYLSRRPARQQPSATVAHISENEVRHAILEQQLEPYYQPKFDLLTGEVLGVEVLARWNHPSKGLLTPAIFLPTLEHCGLMDELLFSLMHQALDLQGQAKRRGVRLNLAFNLQASQLADIELASKIKRMLASHHATGSSLTFELTESGLIEVPAVSLENLVRLRMMGCRLSIDDFGVGFSSLQRLCQLPFNEIKLDAEFVRDIENEPRCRAVISSTLAMGQSLGMSVVIEGIETAAQQQQLLKMGCTQGQGYWHSRPMTGADLLRCLQRSAPSARGLL